ncbi:MAG: uroporphyrinogen decarboxylase family protein [Planctomycetota bacterium]|jgi:uroporphyrinogen decarboxylase|nr:uroporphyrinogen decarboxylase family protein [Planctomycetota bacterium]
MTPKERFVNTLKFEPVDHVPIMEIALWQQTKERWVQEGMPPEVEGGFMHRGSEYFGLEGYETIEINATAPVPPFDQKTISETDEHITFLDGMGRTRLALKTGTVGGQRMSMDTYIDFPVKDAASFGELTRRFEGPVEERYPQDWEAAKATARESDLPLTLMNPLSGTFGYYSMLRNWIGTENLSYMFYDAPALIHECLEFLTDFILRLLGRAVREVKFDFVYIHEDMAGKGGPLMGPQLFRQFILPHYKGLVGFLKANGVDIVLVDTDGDHDVLTPLFLEAGVDGFGPFERAAGMDPVKVRREYGKSVCMIGGVDKREVAKGPEAIEAELERSVIPIIDQGGFIPTIDHAVPPDVSLSNFQYYLDAKRKILER